MARMWEWRSYSGFTLIIRIAVAVVVADSTEALQPQKVSPAESVRVDFGGTERREPVSSSSGFMALSDTRDVIPPDTQGAVSADYVVTMLNSQLRVQNKAGVILKTMSLQSFWSALQDVAPFDPKIVLDPHAGRWLAAAAANRGREDTSLLVGISESADPLGAWNLHRIAGNKAPAVFVDYPSIGYNRHWVAVHIVERTMASNLVTGAQLFVFNKANLYVGGPGESKLFEYETPDWIHVPAITLDPREEMLFCAGIPVRSSTPRATVNLYAIRGPVGSETFEPVKTFPIPNPWQAELPDKGNFAPQLGTSSKIHLQEAWMHSVYVRNGSIWVCHPVFLPAENPARASIQWLELSATEIKQWGRIDDPTGKLFFAYPSLAVNQRNDVLIGFSLFSADSYPSAGYALRLGGDPSGTMRPPIISKRGSGPYVKTLGTGKNRWGDYSSTVVDPVDDLTFWTLQEYSLVPEMNSPNDGSGLWSTWWTPVLAGPLATITGIQVDDAITLTITAAGGFTYEIESTDSLSVNWRLVKTFSAMEPITVMSVPRGGSQAFYRVKTVPE